MKKTPRVIVCKKSFRANEAKKIHVAIPMKEKETAKPEYTEFSPWNLLLRVRPRLTIAQTVNIPLRHRLISSTKLPKYILWNISHDSF